jgi:serine/threonine protein kinase
MASDVFSLGVIFCEILSGKPPNASVAVQPQLASVVGDAQIVSLLSKAGVFYFFIYLFFIIIDIINLFIISKKNVVS